ncbi:EAL domain-containing protein [Paraliobacillus sp. X-1268]|uniref:bifunctional diguanylate cyclase/phosphodiesterase n=1 Tax=Paraliobacillus sp. X-1268 TaxID=2213193 RepID=UPI000E3D236A|nr:EAL domain-containing protein [Paraliobacillus sp. X-1268]
MNQTRYSRLANITKLINTKLELREVLENVVTAISEEIVQCDSVGIYLPEADGTFRGYVGKPQVINGMTLDMQVIDMEEDLLAKEVVDTQKAIYIPDTMKDDRPDSRAVKGFQIKSLLVLPISHEQELFGLVFLFDYGIPMNLTDVEIKTVEAYVNMAAVAIRNSTNLARKENLIKEKQLLLDVTRDLSMCSTMQDVLDKCFYYVGKVLNNTNVGVHLLDPIRNREFKPAKLSKDSDWTEENWMNTHKTFNLGQNNDALFQEVIKTKKAILIPNVYEDTRPSHLVCRNFGIKGLFMVPLVSMGEVLGLVAVAKLEEQHIVYSEASMQLAQSIVDTTASTLANLLYMEKQEQIIEERTSEITTKNKELESAISELKTISREKELILNSAGEGIFGLDLAGNITFCNPASDSMLGYEKSELIGKSYKVIFNGNKANLKENNYKIKGFDMDSEGFNKNDSFYRKDRSSFPVEYVISSIKEQGEIIGDVITFKDVTQRQQMEEEIKYYAYYDSLTDLPNRNLFKDRLNQGIIKAKYTSQKLAVMYLDLDRFKLINDSLGHSYGDLLLKDFANRLRACISKCDTISRQGGDEFSIFLPNIKGKNEILAVIKCINKALCQPFNLKGHEIYIKVSIGVSMFPSDGDNTEELIKNADTAMYRSKEVSGNNCNFFVKGMDTRTFESIKLENALYRALEQDELVIQYQPQVDYQSKQCIGMEALLRWNHPTEGMIPPDKFIPIAEETGLIVSIGEWVIEKACEQLKTWHEQGYPLISVAVNLSVRQFEENDLFTKIKTILKKFNLSPEFLQVELTENQIIKNKDSTLRTMEQLKELGIKIAIDDFGTGYSSLGYLKNFPIHTLKIDKSFIQDIIEDNNNAAITNTIITLAQNLNLNVIAEGVETIEQAEFLASRSCYFMQGFCFSRPLSATDFAQQIFIDNKIEAGGII